LPPATRSEPRGFTPTRSDVLQVLRRPRQTANALLLAPEFVQGRISADFISDTLRTRHGTGWPADALWIVAVRRRDGARIVFGKPGEPVTDVASAVAASCAIPAYFRAVEINGVSYIDGGIHSPTNADVLASSGLDLVIVSSPMSIGFGTPVVRLDLGLRIFFHGYLRNEEWVLRRRGTRVLTIEPDRAVLRAMGLNLMSARHSDEVEERAYELALQRLCNVPLTPALRGRGAPVSRRRRTSAQRTRQLG
jgi:NTE family protein